MKNEEVNFVGTNLRAVKYHSTEMGDTLCVGSTAIPRLAAQKLCGIRTELPRISTDFVKFLVTSTVCKSM